MSIVASTVKALAYLALVAASLYELVVQSLGLAWFWGGIASCDRVIGLLPPAAIVAGLVGLIVQQFTRAVIPSIIALALVIQGVLIGALANARSDVPCGVPMQVNYSWLFFVLVAALSILILLPLISSRKLK